MLNEMTFADKVLRFEKELACKQFYLPDGYNIVNPFAGRQKESVEKVTKTFYKKYYNDTNIRRLMLGSSPARQRSAITGVPFEDTEYLQTEAKVSIKGIKNVKSSQEFIYEMIQEYGGRKKFYSDIYMSFVCPLGITRVNSKGNEVNCNYYDNRMLQESLLSFMVNSIYEQISFGLDTSVCYCIGSGKNFRFLSKINDTFHFFNVIVPLEHPRFIMQYNAKQKSEFIKKYVTSLQSSLF